MQAKKQVSYAESEGDSGDEVFRSISANTSMRPSKRRKVVTDDSDDEFGMDAATEAAMAGGEAGELVLSSLFYEGD